MRRELSLLGAAAVLGLYAAVATAATAPGVPTAERVRGYNATLEATGPWIGLVAGLAIAAVFAWLWLQERREAEAERKLCAVERVAHENYVRTLHQEQVAVMRADKDAMLQHAADLGRIIAEAAEVIRDVQGELAALRAAGWRSPRSG